VGKQRLRRLPASAAKIFLVFLPLSGGLLLPGSALADGGATAQVSAATALAQQLTASAEKTGGAALASAQTAVQGAVTQAHSVTSQAIQGAQETANAALGQAQSAVASATAPAGSGGGSAGVSLPPSSSGTGSSRSGTGSSSSGSAGGPGASGSTPAPPGLPAVESPPVRLPISVPIGGADLSAASAAMATAVTGQLEAAVSAATTEGQSWHLNQAPASTRRPRGLRNPPPPATPHGSGGAPGRAGTLVPELQHPGSGDITPARTGPVHTSVIRRGPRDVDPSSAPEPAYTVPPAPEWFGPASGGTAAAASAGTGSGSSAGVLAAAGIALLIILASGRLSLDLLPLRSKLAALPLERPG
jgi:hypothetical protein